MNEEEEEEKSVAIFLKFFDDMRIFETHLQRLKPWDMKYFKEHNQKQFTNSKI